MLIPVVDVVGVTFCSTNLKLHLKLANKFPQMHHVSYQTLMIPSSFGWTRLVSNYRNITNLKQPLRFKVFAAIGNLVQEGTLKIRVVVGDL